MFLKSVDSYKKL